MSVSFDLPEGEEEQRELSVQEEYQLWRKNCPYMYDFVSETALTWPSLTIQWLPDELNKEGPIPQRLLLGTHTSGEDIDYLKIASTELPRSLLPDTLRTKDAEDEVKQQTVNARLKITKKFKHDGEINRARYYPFNPSQVATINGKGDVFLYDTNNKEAAPILLKQHTDNGYGLSWSPLVANQLLTASDDSTIVLWDASKTDKPQYISKDHKDIVNEVQWHRHDANVFGSVSDDKTVRLFDAREFKNTSTIDRTSAINTIAFSPFSHNLFAIGLQDSTIELFDIRNPSHKLHTIMGHSDSITSLEWDPHHDGVLASGSQNRRVILWDLKRIGEEQVQEDEDDGAPELFLMHAGHTSAITDISFNPHIPWTLATAADDNIVHLWKVNKKLTDEYYGITEEVDVFTLE